MALPPERDFRPWEQLGTFRRDCDPHRGPLLLWSGRAGLACGLLALFLPILALGALGWAGGLALVLLFDLTGLGLGAAVNVLARRDLASMGAGTMDPAGWHDTSVAQGTAFGALIVSTVAGLLCLALGCYLALR
jgi:hypothetical protein